MTVSLRTGLVFLILVVAVLFCIGSASAEVSGTERINLTGYSVDTSSTVSPGTTLNIPVTLSGFPRGINQYAIEFIVSAPNLSLSDVTVTLDKTMIQHTASAPSVESDTGVHRRYIRTVNMEGYPNYGVSETAVGTLKVHLPASPTKYDAVLSVHIVETTSGEPLEAMATPSTGDIVIHVAESTKKAAKTSSSPLSFIGVLAAAAGAFCLARRKQS